MFNDEFSDPETDVCLVIQLQATHRDQVPTPGQDSLTD